MSFTRSQLLHFSGIATERAARDAALRWPAGPERDAEALRLMQRYYAEYVTPPMGKTPAMPEPDQ